MADHGFSYKNQKASECSVRQVGMHALHVLIPALLLLSVVFYLRSFWVFTDV
jgi:heme/copper-type cytochrome/quinol oxidase subunit 3